MLQRSILAVTIAGALMWSATGLISAQNPGSKNKSSQNKSASPSSAKAVVAGDVARGKYIVESVAMCGQCHTPLDSDGNPDRSQWLQGSSVPYMPAQPNGDWPIRAPRIGGNPPANDADMVRLLTTGIWVNGNRLRQPMPQFRLNNSDAEAVVAYLKSLAPKP